MIMATSIRLFTDAPLAAGCCVPASAEQAHYLAHVLRRGPGEPVLLFNGTDGEWSARIDQLGRRGGGFIVEARTRRQEEEPADGPWLAFALLKRDATDLVVQKATELGVARILPVLAAHGQAGRVNPERLRSIAREAAEQCERLSLPRIDPPVDLATLLAHWPAERRLAAALERRPGLAGPAGQGGLLVGPEGGFSGAELDVLLRHPFVVGVPLGPRILRAETAVIAGLALLQAGGAGAVVLEPARPHT